MNRSHALVLTLAAAATLSVGSFGCAKGESKLDLAPAPVAPETPAFVHEARADVKLVVRDETGETWRGKTVLPSNGTWVTVDEEVTLDASGRLLHAFTRVTDEGGIPESTWVERGTDTVTIERGPEVRRFHPPVDRPWIYAAVHGSDGAHIATPLCAWTTYRVAAKESNVRLVEGRTSSVVPSDQLVVDTENGTTLAIGEDGVDVDARFIQTLRLKNLTFAREAGNDGTYSFSVSKGKGATSSGG